MKYALVAAIIAVLFAIQSAHAADSKASPSAFDIASELIDASELPKSLPQSAKKAPETAVVAEEETEISAASEDAVMAEEPSEEIAEVSSKSKDEDAADSAEGAKENSAELPEAPAQDERQPAAAEEMMVAEAPGTIDFDMATIDMIPDALPAPKANFSEIAKSK